jgi:broad specificity phosphatase PhoE
MKRTALLLLVAALLTATALSAAPIKLTTVILVRHGEKSAPSGDVPLSEAGVVRAKELARVLTEGKLTAVLTTPYERTRTTAKPVAEAAGLPAVEIATGKTYAADVVAKIRKDYAGGTVLVVGHSNTTVDVLKELGVANAREIADSEYDNFYVVTIGEGVETKAVALRYGAVVR